MRAAYVEELGPADTIRVGELPDPVPGPTDVLVAVQTVAVNPVDALVRSGRYRTPVPFPFVVGRDLVGTVAAVGSEAVPFAVGDRVWCNSLGHEGRQGSFAELAVVPADRLYPLPDGVDPGLAVAVAHPAGTAYLGWFVHTGLRAGQTVLVGGAAGNVGTAAVQLAAAAGARVIATARPEDHDRCKAAGAEAVLDYRDPALANHVLEAAPDGVHIAWDTSGHNDLDLAARVCRPGARVLLTAARSPVREAPLAALYTRDITLAGFVISRATAPQLAGAAALVNDLLRRGLLTARIADELPLAQTAETHRRIEQRGVRGRLLLHV
ncbi:MAG TPA: NADPH:quinone reductase [Nocardioidaceae bacterium]|nr:NADPH:quinone reductase [Nocardioidaceae bacterium]